MDNQMMLDFLLENDVVIKSTITDRSLTADEAFELGGEFVVFEFNSPDDLYRGNSFDDAMTWLDGRE